MAETTIKKAEYLRKMAEYQRVDDMLTQKYGLSFAEFLAQDVVAQRGYNWEVEQDAMQWETAVGGVQTMQRQLREIGDA
jgi:hypothetical protein